MLWVQRWWENSTTLMPGKRADSRAGEGVLSKSPALKITQILSFRTMTPVFKCHRLLGQFVNSPISSGKFMNSQGLIQMTTRKFWESSRCLPTESLNQRVGSTAERERQASSQLPSFLSYTYPHLHEGKHPNSGLVPGPKVSLQPAEVLQEQRRAPMLAELLKDEWHTKAGFPLTRSGTQSPPKSNRPSHARSTLRFNKVLREEI